MTGCIMLCAAMTLGQLGSSVRVESSSTGTIIRYVDGDAYVVGCGHPFKAGETTASVEVWHMGQAFKYSGVLLMHEWDGGIHDVSLIKFRPDFIPEVAAVAPLGFNPDPGRGKDTYYISVGTDGYTAPAEYGVLYLWREKRANGLEQLCCEGKAVGGRSGGGLFDHDGRLIGICSRSSRNPNRIYYSSYTQLYRHEQIRKLLEPGPAVVAVRK